MNRLQMIGGGYALELADMMSTNTLTVFGKFARYLLVVGIDLYARDEGNDDAINHMKAIKTKAFGILDIRALTEMGIPVDIVKRELDSETIDEVYGADIRRWYRKVVKEDSSIPKVEKLLFTKASTFMAYGNKATDSIVRAVERLAWAVGKTLGRLFNDVVRLGKGGEGSTSKLDVKSLYTNLRSLTKSLTGSASLALDATTVRDLKTSGDAGLRMKQYRQLRAKIKDMLNSAVSDITSSGPLPVDKVADRLKRIGFEHLTFPVSRSGFRGLVGMFEGKLSLYGENGKRINGNLPPDAKIVMNKKYDSELDNGYILSYKATNAVSETRVYTVEYKSQAIHSKYVRVKDNSSQVNRWIAAWKRDINSTNLMRKIPAAAAYVLYYTGARVGSRLSNASLKGADQTYGITTLRVKHMKITGSIITLTYVGKKGERQVHKLKPDSQLLKKVIKIMKALKGSKKPNDLLWSFVRPTSRDGAIQTLNSSFFRSYMKSSGMTINIHGLRHIRGTTLARQLLESTPWKPGTKVKTLAQKQKAAEDYVKNKILAKVGVLLGHKATSNSGDGKKVAWRVAITNYIVPNVIADFFLSNKLEVPKWVPPSITSV